MGSLIDNDDDEDIEDEERKASENIPFTLENDDDEQYDMSSNNMVVGRNYSHSFTGGARE